MDNLPRSRTPPRWTSAWRRPGSCGPAVGDTTDCSAAALVPAAPLAVIAATGGGANGVFVDGCHHVALADCQYSTCGEDGASCCHVSPHAELEFNQVTWSLATCSPSRASVQGLVLAVEELKTKLGSDSLVIGNGLQNYDFNAGNGNPTYDMFVDAVDGFCMEHVMAFEGVLIYL